MKKILSKILSVIGIILVVLLVLWQYPLTMKREENGDYTCHNIFGHYVQCD